MNIKRGKRPIFSSVDTLTPLMRGRYNSSYPRYKDRTLAYLSHQSDRGQNSYEVTSAKADAINGRTGNERNYDRALIAAFTQGVKFDPGQVSSRVCDIRHKFGYGRMKGRNIDKLCLDELRRVFIVHEHMVENGGDNGAKGKRKRVFEPVFSLLAE